MFCTGCSICTQATARDVSSKLGCGGQLTKATLSCLQVQHHLNWPTKSLLTSCLQLECHPKIAIIISSIKSSLRCNASQVVQQQRWLNWFLLSPMLRCHKTASMQLKLTQPQNKSNKRTNNSREVIIFAQNQDVPIERLMEAISNPDPTADDQYAWGNLHHHWCHRQCHNCYHHSHCHHPNKGPVVDDFSTKPFLPTPPLEAMMEGKFNRVPFIR